jgi:hypothetical protein
VLCAGILAASVDWSALKVRPDMPGVSPGITDVRQCLREYLDYATDMESVKRQTLRHGPDTGFRSLNQVQSEHDSFVCASEGRKMFEVMSKGHDKTSTYSAIAGGHVTGFMRAPSVLVPAVLKAFEVLKNRN